MAKNWTQKLRVLQRDRNARAVVSSGPYAGREVEYHPRYGTDRLPWLLKTSADKNQDHESVRFNGRDCRPDYPEDNQ